MAKISFVEKTYVASMRHFQCVPTTYVTELFGNLHFPSIMSIVFTSIKPPKLPISIKIPVTLLQIDYIFRTAISPNLSS